MTHNTFLLPGKRIHMVGITETTMSSLAMLLQNRGFTVTGSDMFVSSTTSRLKEKGIEFRYGHRAENINGADCVIRTAAARDDNPEIIAAKAAEIPILDCSQVLSAVAREFKNVIYIEGSVLGKNSTAAMIAHIFMEAQKDPTVMIKEHMKLLGGNYRNGRGDVFIIQSSAWQHAPLPGSRVVVLNALDADFFPPSQMVENVKASFHRITGLPPKSGFLITDGEAMQLSDALQDFNPAVCSIYTSFGLSSENDVHLTNVDSKWHSFDIVCSEEMFCHVGLKVYGKKNVLSALAAVAVAWRMGIPAEAVVRGLESYPGPSGYFEHKGVCHGADVFDDSSYHPAQIKVLLETVRDMGYNRIIVAIQPQFLIRSKDYIPELTDALAGADYVVVMETYGICELGMKDSLSKDLTANIPVSIYLKYVTEVSEHLASIAGPGDVILTIGPGDIYKVSNALCDYYKA
ncbi:MAG: hypothetical protein IKM73_08185 [Acidaminococcaceae bacterium]|nr:hypothetical protein [Acidaminococcaceae bacterium]